MEVHRLDSAGALARLRSQRDGLTAAEARRRLAEFGPNRLEPVRGEPPWRRLGKTFVHFFALILWLAAALAFIAEWRQPGQGMATLGLAIVGVIVVNGLFAFWQDYRAELTLRALERLLPQRAKVRRAGSAALVVAEEIVPGDVVMVAAGDIVPADCRVIEAHRLLVNTAVLTGEALPRPRDSEPAPAGAPAESRNLLFAGTAIAAGEGTAVVFATGAHTEFGRIARLAQATPGGLSPLLVEIAHVSRVVAALASLLGVIFFLIGLRLELGFWENFIFAIGIIVANVPEGLLPTVTLALAMGAQRMARRNVLVRHLPAIEALGSATVVCTDKTGTLTENRMALRTLHLDGSDFEPTARMPPGPLARFAAVARWCQTLERGAGGQWLGDPMERELVDFAERQRRAGAEAPRLSEIPFDAERMRLVTVHALAEGPVLLCKGALAALLPLCTAAETAEGPQLLDAERRAAWIAAEARLAERGLRLLAFAYRVLPPAEAAAPAERDLVLVGLAGFEDPPRAEVAAAVARAREAGVRVIVVTGDHAGTTLAIAREIGLIGADGAAVIGGDELAAMSDIALQLALDADPLIVARASPEQKLRLVKALQRKGEIVAVTGDGVNDAPALKEADVGVAMGRSGTDVARAAADIVLLDDNFASIVGGIEEGRAIFANIRKFMTYILTSNIPEIVPFLAFVLFGIPLPLTIIQILAVDLGTDMLPALALGAEPPHAGVMRRAPRPRGERLLSWPLLARAYLFLGPLEAAAAMAAFFFVLDVGGWSLGMALGRSDPLYLRATGACLAAIVVTQAVNVLQCRSERQSAFALPLRANPLILAGIAAELALIAAIVYTPLGNALFGTAPLDLSAWLFMLPFAVAMLVAEEARKAALRGFTSPPATRTGP
jgi:calcium-translocating P-type ATPase